MYSVGRKYTDFAKEQRTLFREDKHLQKCPYILRERLIGEAWREFYKFQHKYTYENTQIYRFEMVEEREEGEGERKKKENDIWILSLDDWLASAFLADFTPKFKLFFKTDPTELQGSDINKKNKIISDTNITNIIDDESYDDIIKNSSGELIVNGVSYKFKAFSTNVKLDLRCIEDIMIDAKERMFRNNPLSKFGNREIFEYFCLVYRIVSMMKLIQLENRKMDDVNKTLSVYKDELLSLAWHPDRFFDWVLCDEEKNDIKDRWS